MNIRYYKIIIKKEIRESKYRLLVFYIFFIALSFIFLLNKQEINFKEISDVVAPSIGKIVRLIELKFYFLSMILISSSSIYLVIESIVKEKENRTLEAFLCLPLKDIEIIYSKIFHIVMFSYLLILLNLIMLQVYLYSDNIMLFANCRILIFVFLTAPNLLVLFTTLGLLISSMNAKFRTAQNVAILVLLPFQCALFLYLNGSYILSFSDLFKTTSIIIVLNIVTFLVSPKLFNREKMITRY